MRADTGSQDRRGRRKQLLHASLWRYFGIFSLELNPSARATETKPLVARLPSLRDDGGT
jgi:hypothetical protein